MLLWLSVASQHVRCRSRGRVSSGGFPPGLKRLRNTLLAEYPAGGTPCWRNTLLAEHLVHEIAISTSWGFADEVFAAVWLDRDWIAGFGHE